MRQGSVPGHIQKIPGGKRNAVKVFDFFSGGIMDDTVAGPVGKSFYLRYITAVGKRVGQLRYRLFTFVPYHEVHVDIFEHLIRD